MKNVDVKLIQRVLDGDDTAFSELVKKYYKSVHALAWRKIQDFHIAEDITQETFLRAYKGLSTLKEQQSFESWLYVITANRCKTWLSKKRLQTQSLENTDTAELEKATYSSYVSAENERTSVEAQREVVKKLLAKLQESDRTVITLYYLGGMTYEEISKFLGVSVSAIKNRLYRARQHLKKEEPMIREALENYQITPHLTENIMREVSRLKPAVPTGSKPLVPWAVATASVLLIMIMLGIDSQNLIRFQQPYSVDAQTEMTIELIDTPIVLNVDTEPDVINQLSNSSALGRSEKEGQKPDETLLAAVGIEEENNISTPQQQWMRGNGPVGHGYLLTHFHSPEGELYIVYNEGRNYKLYKLPVGETEFQHISDITSNPDTFFDSIFMMKWNNTLYFVGSNELNELFASNDGGETWVSSGRCPEGWVVGLEVLDDRFYLAFEHKIFVSDDIGKTWCAVEKGLTGDVSTLKVIQKTLLSVTSTGLHHLEDGNWQRIQFPITEAKKILSLAGTEKNLYVLTACDWKNVGPQNRTWWLFRSTDKGQTWTDITPTNAMPIMGPEPFDKEPNATLVTVKNILLLIGSRGAAVVRSIDNGSTWTLEKNNNITLMPDSIHNAVALNENTFYLQGNSGLYLSNDGGLSWKRSNPGMKGSIVNLINVKTNRIHDTPNSLYAIFSGGMQAKWVYKSSDKGESWRVVNPEIRFKEFIPSFTRIAESDNVLYAKSQGPTSWAVMGLCRFSEDHNTLVPIKGMPTFNAGTLVNLLSKRMGAPHDQSDKEFLEQLQDSSVGATQFFKQLTQLSKIGNPFTDELQESGLNGVFAVSGDTYYLEYNYKLFRWEPGDTEWQETEQEETAILTWKTMWRELKLAVKGDTIYAGKRDGRLVVSFDKGTNWIDLTPILPFPVRTFNDIVIVGDTVYVATDAGVAASDQGNNWGSITDSEETNLIMDILSADGTTLYGVIKDTGIYRLESGKWKQIVSEIPDNVTSLAVDGNTLYVGTQEQGMLHFTLKE